MRSHSESDRRASLLSYKLFGFPQSILNNDDRNSDNRSKNLKNKRNKFNKPVKLD